MRDLNVSHALGCVGNWVRTPKDRDEVNRREVLRAGANTTVLSDTLQSKGLAECAAKKKIDLLYYESRKRELKTRLTYEDQCDERLQN